MSKKNEKYLVKMSRENWGSGGRKGEYVDLFLEKTELATNTSKV